MNAPNPSSRMPSFRLVCAALAALLLAMPEVHAATYYWDTNDSTAGFGTAGGTWAAPTTNNSTQGWSASSAGTNTLSGTTTTSTLDALNFGTASAGLAAGTITVSGNVNANSLTFGSASGNITLSGGNITIGGTTPTITVNNAQVTIAKLLGINTASGLTKNGTGKLVVQGGPVVNNATYPVTINGGTLRFETTTADVGWAGNYTINNGATFETLGGVSGTNRQLWNGSKFNFDSNGGGTVTFDNQNPILNSSVFTTTGGAMNTVGGNANFNGQGGKTLTFNVATGTDAVDLQVSASLGNMGFTKTGNGVMALTNTANSLNAGITISAGTLEVASSGRLNSGSYSVNIINNGTFSYNSTSTQTLSGVLSGTGALTKSNTSTLTLSGSNTYSGGTTINGGAIQINHANALGTTGNITFGGGGLTYGTGITQDLSSRIKNSGSAIVIDTNSNDVTFASAVDSTNSGGLTKNGTGTLTLSATNTYSGSTTLNAGTLQVDGNIASSGLVINSGGTISPGTTAAASSFGTSSITINGGGYLWTLNTANGSAGSGWDQITSTGALTSSGALTVYAYGTPGDWDGTASYSWDIFNANSTSGFSAGNFTMNLDNFGIAAGNRTGTWAFSNPSGGIIRLSYTPLSDPVWTGGTGSFSTGFSPAPSNGDDLFFSGTGGGTATNDTLTSAGSITFMIGAGAYTLSGNAITVTGAVTNNSSSTQTLNTNVTPGSIVINDGAVEIGAAGRLGGGSTSATISNSGTLIYSGTNDQTLSGVISGSGAVTKNGSGTLTLSAANTYTGGTTVNSGTLILTGGTGRIVGALTVNGSGVAQYSVNSHNYFGSLSSLTISNGGTFIDGAIGGYVQTTPSVTFNNGGTLTSAAGANGNGEFGNFLFNGPITVSGTGLATINATGVSFNYDQTITVADTVSGSGVDLEISSKIGNERSLGYTLTKAGAGTLLLTGNNTSYANWTISSGTLEIGGSGRLMAGNYNGTIGNSGTFIYSGTNDQTLSGVISGSGVMIKDGASTLTLSGNNTRTGGFTLGITNALTTGGIVVLNHNNALGTGTLVFDSHGSVVLGTSGLTIANNVFIGNRFSTGQRIMQLDLAGAATGAFSGNFDIRRGNGYTQFDVGTDDTLTLSGLLYNGAAEGGFEKNGAGTLVLTSNNTYNGATVVSAGTLQIGAGGTSGSLTNKNNAVTNNGTLVFNRSDAITVANAISGTGVLTQDGSGTLTLTGSNTYTGQTNIQGGKVVFTNSSAFGTSSKIVMGLIADQTQELEFGANALTLDRNIMIQNATGIKTIRLDLAGTNTGAISGQLDIRSQYSGNFVVDVGASDTLTFSGDVVTGAGGGAGLTKVNSGTLVLTGSNSYSGGTTLNSGTLVIGNAAAAGAGTITQTDGTSLLTFDTTGTIANAMSIYNVASTQSVTLSGAITAQNTTYDVASGTTLSINGSIGGSGGVTKDGDGTLELNAANTFTGDTVVNFGTLEANATGSLASTGNITVTGGSLLVGASNAIGDSVDMELAGGNLAFSGTVSDTIGALTLSANSVIDLGTGSVTAIFADLFMGSYTLAVHNWTGTTLWNGGTGDNTDKIYFNRNLSSGELDRISFYSDFGSSFLGTGFQLGLGSGFQYEVIPVPEPETWTTAALLLIGGGVWMWRRKRHAPARA